MTHAEKDYVMSILTAGGGTGSQGQLVSIADTVSGTGTASLTITDNTILGSSAKVKLIATILKTSVTQKNKTNKHVHKSRDIFRLFEMEKVLCQYQCEANSLFCVVVNSNLISALCSLV